MASNNCVKISYQGITHQIVCDDKFQYDDLLKTIMDKFNIENSLKLAIEVYSESGQKFDKNTFEYLLLLFPQPQNIFFIRLDSTKIPSNAQTKEDYNSETNNGDTTAMECDTYYNAVPVRRQNCFIGEWPSLNSTQSSQHSGNFVTETVKCLPENKQLNNLNHFNRTLRI